MLLFIFFVSARENTRSKKKSTRCTERSLQGLLAKDAAQFDIAFTKNQVLSRMKAEWELVLRMESRSHSANLMKKHVPYTRWQVYRETMSVLEKNKWTVSQEVLDLLSAWWPPVQASANVKDVFASLQDTLKRATKSDCGSLANLSCCAIRAVEDRTKQSPSLQNLSLVAEDFEGPQVRGLKPSIFEPQSCPASSSYMTQSRMWSRHYRHNPRISYV